MHKYIKHFLILVSTVFIFTSCTTSTRYVTVKDEKTGENKVFAILEQIEIKLINDYEELYNIEDVILGYKLTKYNPLDAKLIANRFKSYNKEFNSMYSEFPKMDLEKIY